MAENINKDPEQEKESFLDKAKEWADKAEDFFEDASEKFKKVMLLRKLKNF